MFKSCTVECLRGLVEIALAHALAPLSASPLSEPCPCWGWWQPSSHHADSRDGTRDSGAGESAVQQRSQRMIKDRLVAKHAGGREQGRLQGEDPVQTAWMDAHKWRDTGRAEGETTTERLQ